MERIIDYETAFDYLKETNRLERKVANNTRIRMHDIGSIILKYHDSDILIYRLNGSILFNSCGFRTRTTKDRLNGFQNLIYIYQHDFDWHVSSSKIKAVQQDADGCVDFFDGMIVSREGEIINA